MNASDPDGDADADERRDQDRSDRPRIRLQRVLADAGVAARRRCEQLIEEGRVEVNGEVRSTLPVFVDPTRDSITVDGKPIARQPSRGVRFTYIVMHKPPRTLCTSADEPEIGRVTVLDLVDHPAKSRLFPVGRLGWNESGLVLLTNDGEMANRLSHPRYGVPKVYLAAVKGDVRESDLKNLTKEMYKLQRLESRRSGRVGAAGRGSRVEVEIAKSEPGKTLLRLTMREGKNKFVSDVLGKAGFAIRKLAAVAIGPLQLRGLTVGMWRELTRDEIRVLRKACRPGGMRELEAEAEERDARHGDRANGRPGSRRRVATGSSSGGIGDRPARPTRTAITTSASNLQAQPRRDRPQTRPSSGSVAVTSRPSNSRDRRPSADAMQPPARDRQPQRETGGRRPRVIAPVGPPAAARAIVGVPSERSRPATLRPDSAGSPSERHPHLDPESE